MIDSFVIDYFENVYLKKENPEVIEEGFRNAVKNMAADVYASYRKIYGWKPGQSLESYDGNTPLFDIVNK